MQRIIYIGFLFFTHVLCSSGDGMNCGSVDSVEDVVGWFAAHMPHIDSKTECGESLLVRSVVENSPAVTLSLLDHKADPCQRTSGGETSISALDLAILYSPDIVTLLVEEMRKKRVSRSQ